MPTDRFHTPSESNRPNHLQRPGRASPPPRGSAGGARSPTSTPGPRPRPHSAESTNREPALPTDGTPQPGDWLWTCRPGAEDDVRDELSALGISSRPLQAGLVLSSPRGRTRAGTTPAAFATLTFARQGLPVGLCRSISDLELGEAAALIVDGLYRGFKGRPIAVHVYAADSEAGKPLSSRCTALSEAIAQDLAARGYPVAASGPAAHAEGGQILMVCLLSADNVVAGVQLSSAALSLHPGGVQRVRRPAEAPSRSAHKLSEALAWLGHGPQSGEDCVDLGAAPGGWSQVLAERGCPVIAVDTGGLAPGLSRRIKHVRQNAFEFVPEMPVDWLCCDLAYRPLEVAALLARWGRRRWARFVIANIKLPMKQKVAMLDRVREILASGGWTGLKVRQLYHDRDEVTLFAWRGFGLDTRVQPRRPAG
ncbi:MAG TPA: 23S rRNA (cytidine(2498)-2'-O)-methyltransferase RlmM, partial [Pseudomonadota bacterium]|nr:23S rRNA (cytidine(2498)-2'-O)-methyltransferase RlmM [Pseudomonadota bacterium]